MMRIKSRMSKDVLTVTPNDPISKAIMIMEREDLHRLPVVEGKRLVGLITKGMISSRGASKATSLSIFELNYLLSKTDVKTIMEDEVITIDENDFLEDAALKMLQHDIGCLPVMHGENLVGILTQNDMFTSFIDLLGYGYPGSRVCVQVKDGKGVLEKVTKIFADADCDISHIGVYEREAEDTNIIIRIDKEDTKELERALECAGFKVLSVDTNRPKK
ncbi:MAG: CBS and ACT domain-containing protein [Breznakia sp.]